MRAHDPLQSRSYRTLVIQLLIFFTLSILAFKWDGAFLWAVAVLGAYTVGMSVRDIQSIKKIYFEKGGL